MALKPMIFVVALIGVVGKCSAGLLPIAAAPYVAPYVSSYNAHVVNHAISAPVVAPVTSAHYLTHPHVYDHVHATPFIYSEPLVVAK